jgi:hypothetical protein
MCHKTFTNKTRLKVHEKLDHGKGNHPNQYVFIHFVSFFLNRYLFSKTTSAELKNKFEKENLPAYFGTADAPIYFKFDDDEEPRSLEFTHDIFCPCGHCPLDIRKHPQPTSDHHPLL